MRSFVWVPCDDASKGKTKGAKARGSEFAPNTDCPYRPLTLKFAVFFRCWFVCRALT